MKVEKRHNLIELRGKRTLVDVSKHLGLTPQMLGLIELGKRDPSLKVMNRIADYYSSSLDELFGIKK